MLIRLFLSAFLSGLLLTFSVPAVSQHVRAGGRRVDLGCGPTAVEMMTAYYADVAGTPRLTAQALRDANRSEINAAGQMSPTSMYDELIAAGYNVEIRVGASWADVQEWAKRGPVLLTVHLWLRPAGPPHAIVVTGINGDTVSYNDPWTGRKHTATAARVQRSWISGGMMAIWPKG